MFLCCESRSTPGNAQRLFLFCDKGTIYGAGDSNQNHSCHSSMQIKCLTSCTISLAPCLLLSQLMKRSKILFILIRCIHYNSPLFNPEQMPLLKENSKLVLQHPSHLSIFTLLAQVGEQLR